VVAHDRKQVHQPIRNASKRPGQRRQRVGHPQEASALEPRVVGHHAARRSGGRARSPLLRRPPRATATGSRPGAPGEERPAALR
jgi:hypothetical protein